MHFSEYTHFSENIYDIGFTCGTFDLFHAGHVSMLREAKKYCKHLIVGIQTDPSIDRAHKNKPIQTLLERQIQVNGCRYVDETVVYTTEEDLMTILLTYPIDVRFVGEEYKNKEFTGKSLGDTGYGGRFLSDSNPMKIIYNSRQHKFSSSELRERIVQQSTHKAKTKNGTNQ